MREKLQSRVYTGMHAHCGGPNLQMLASELAKVGGEWWVLGTLLNGGKLQKAKYWVGAAI